MNDALKILLALIRFEIFGQALPDEIKALVTPDAVKAVSELSQAHDIANIAADALYKNGLISRSDEYAAPLFKQLDLSLMRFAQFDYALAEASGALSGAKIAHIPLKGSVIKNMYPEPWMRTSCDVDVLVRKSDFDAARAVIESLGYSFFAQTAHDVSLSLGNVHIELHFDLVEDGRANDSNAVLRSVWDEASAAEDGYRFALSDAMFYFYHIAHIVKHLEESGCGIRQIIDLYVLDSLPDFDLSARDALLEKGGLLTFANAARKLAKVWFSNGEHDGNTRGLESLIVVSGVYGTSQTSVTIKTSRAKNRLSYFIERLFPPYQTMLRTFPVLQKHRWLLPFTWIGRFFRLFNKDTFKRSKAEIAAANSLSDEDRQKTAGLFSRLGLKIYSEIDENVKN